MKLLDKLVLALKSAVGGAVDDIVGEDLPSADKAEATRRLIERAQARIDALKADAERANKRGDADLYKRLEKEIGDLQKTIDKTQARLSQLEGREASVTTVEKVPEVKREQRGAQAETDAALREREEAAAKREDNAAARDEIDNTRIADALKRDGKS